METHELKKKLRLPDGSFAISDFEKKYIAVRKKELRHYTDDQVAALPDISPTHPHYIEWQIRKKSCARLIRHIKKNKKHLNILEVGCGNGWLSSKIADIENVTVTAIDVNIEELRQGSSVFKNKRNLAFSYEDLRDNTFDEKKFDIIVFAASIQYFPSLSQILQTALKLLTQHGEIHVFDSPLYKDGEPALAKQRTKVYYESLGFPEMSEYYHHHALSILSRFKYKIMYNPFSILAKLVKKRSPFYWVCISQFV